MVLELIVSILTYLVLAVFLSISSINLITAFMSLKQQEYLEFFFPTVSVVVRTWNDGSVVERCIQNFLKQNYPKKEFEIIIVDDGSKDNTKEICEKYARDGKIKYVRLPEHHEFKSEVIDHAIGKFSTGDIILETDVDFVLPNDWIKEMVKPFSNEQVMGVTGRVMCGNWYENWLTHIRAIEDFWYFCITMFGRYKFTGQGTLYGSSKAYRKSFWKEIGGHPKVIVEDAGLFAEIIARGHKIVNVKVTNLAEEVNTLKQYFAERKRWAGGNIEVFSRYGKTFRTKLLFYIVLLSNFSIDGILLLSFILMFFQQLFFIPIFMHMIAIWIGLWGVKAQDHFYLWSVVYISIGPILQILAVLAAFKDKITKGTLVWEKVWHHPTLLNWPTKFK